jgi:hypothetical protein
MVRYYGLYGDEPCDDADPTPDYENVLTDWKPPPLWTGLRVGCACTPGFSGLGHGPAVRRRRLSAGWRMPCAASAPVPKVTRPGSGQKMPIGPTTSIC